MKHLDRIITFVRTAGGASETATDRNGFLSHHTETHALGIGLAAGFTAVAFNEASLLGIVYGAAAHGRVQESEGRRRSITQDCMSEPQYALAGLVAGGVLGAGTRMAMGQGALPLGLMD